MAGFTAADVDAAKAAYLANADYEEADSATKAAAFVTACRKLLIMQPKRSREAGGTEIELEIDTTLLPAQIAAAQAFIAAASAGTASVIHPDLSCFPR